jgi:dolichol-phosphate mannosyltransferase
MPALASVADRRRAGGRPSANAVGIFPLSRGAAGLIAGFGLIHLAMIAFVGLSGDEAYYWEWSRHPAWGYYDHPPMVAWLIALGTALFGDSGFGVRIAVVPMSVGVLWFVYQLAAHFASHASAISTSGPAPHAVGFWSVAMLAASPLFGMGGLLATPDVPMVFFWAASVWLMLHAVSQPRWRYWLLLGLMLGLGMLSKYPMALLPPALLAVAAATARGRVLLRTPGPYLAMAVACAVCIPHAVWLAQHEFASVLYQLSHGLQGGARSLVERLDMLLAYVGRQAGVLTPLLFLFYLAALWHGFVLLRQRPAERRETVRFTLWLLVLPALLTWLLFATASLFAKPQANWPVAAYVTLSVLGGVLLARCVFANRLKKYIAYSAPGLAAAVTLYAHVEVLYPLAPYETSVFDKVQDRRALADWLHVQRRAQGPEGLSAAILADNYRTASQLAFYLPDRPWTDAPFEAASGSQYALWRARRARTPGGMAWYITRHEHDRRVEWLFSASRLAGVFAERRAGASTGRVYVHYGRLRREP